MAHRAIGEDAAFLDSAVGKPDEYRGTVLRSLEAWAHRRSHQHQGRASSETFGKLDLPPVNGLCSLENCKEESENAMKACQETCDAEHVVFASAECSCACVHGHGFLHACMQAGGKEVV